MLYAPLIEHNLKLEEGLSKILENSMSGLTNFWKFKNSKTFKWMMLISWKWHCYLQVFADRLQYISFFFTISSQLSTIPSGQIAHYWLILVTSDSFQILFFIVIWEWDWYLENGSKGPKPLPCLRMGFHCIDATYRFLLTGFNNAPGENNSHRSTVTGI